MNLFQFKDIFSRSEIKYSQLSAFLKTNDDLKKELEKIYVDYSDRFSFKIFVKYFILGLLDKRCKKCGCLLTYKQIKDNRNYCSNQCSNSDQLVKERIKQSNMQKYGVVSAAKLPSVVEKMKQTNLKKYGFEWASKRFKKEKADKKMNYSLVDNNNCNIVYQQQLFNVDVSRSQILNQICEYISEKTNQQCICRCGNLIDGQVVDVYCPSKAIACQIVQTQVQQSRMCNVKRISKCESLGVRVIHILCDEWMCKKQLVKDRIDSIVGDFSNRIYARNCQIKDLGVQQCRQFLNLNHIQGADLSKVKYGLYYGGQLVSVMTFGKPRFNEEYEWQLIRYASKLGCQVIGGAGKLLKYFQRNYNPKNIISYADRRYSNGKLYYALGFQFLEDSKPNYWWCRGNVKLTRYQCQKHKLSRILGDNFDQKLSQSLNMKNNGYIKVFDCGNMVFEKKYC